MATKRSIEDAKLQDDICSNFGKLSSSSRLSCLICLSDLCSFAELHKLRLYLNSVLSCDFLMRLPTELSHLVLLYLDAKSLLACCRVSKAWNDLISNDDALWKHLCVRFGYSKRISQSTVDASIKSDVNSLCRSKDRLQEIMLRRLEDGDDDKNNPYILSSNPYDSASCDTDELPYASNWSTVSALTPFANASTTLANPITSTRMPAECSCSVGFAEFSLASAASTSSDQSNEYNLSGEANEDHEVKSPNSGSLAIDGNKSETFKKHFLRCHAYAQRVEDGSAIERMVLFGHTQRITAIYYWNRLLATGADDHTVIIWDCNTGSHNLTIQAQQSISAIKFNERCLLIGSYDTTATLWRFTPDGTSAERASTYSGHVATIFSVDFNEGLDRVVTGSLESVVKVWALESGELLHTLGGIAPDCTSNWITCVRIYEVSTTDDKLSSESVEDEHSRKDSNQSTYKVKSDRTAKINQAIHTVLASLSSCKPNHSENGCSEFPLNFIYKMDNCDGSEKISHYEQRKMNSAEGILNSGKSLPDTKTDRSNRSVYCVWGSGNAGGGCWILVDNIPPIAFVQFTVDAEIGSGKKFLGVDVSSDKLPEMKFACSVVSQYQMSVPSHNSPAVNGFLADIGYLTCFQTITCATPKFDLLAESKATFDLLTESSSSPYYTRKASSGPVMSLTIVSKNILLNTSEFSRPANMEFPRMANKELHKQPNVDFCLLQQYVTEFLDEYISLVGSGRSIGVFLCRTSECSSTAYLRMTTGFGVGVIKRGGAEEDVGGCEDHDVMVDGRTVLTLRLPDGFRENKRGTTLTLGDRRWLDEGLCDSLAGSLIYAVALPDNRIELVRFSS